MRTAGKLLSMCPLACLLVAACGDDGDQNLAEPRLIAGGGLGDGAIKGRLNIHVIDGDTDAPIGNASVSIGEPGAEPLTGLTDSTGLLTVDDDALDGPTTITVTADGYVTQTWFGANGANATIPLDREGSAPAVPQATLRGTIAGWNDIPLPASDKFIVGLVGYSQTDELGAAENQIAQGSGSGGVPANACVRSSLLTRCDWELRSRTGRVAIFAIIAEVDTNGTPTDTSDDTQQVIGFAYEPAVDVEDGVAQSGLSLTQLEIGAMTELGASIAAPPSGLTEASVVFGLDTGDDGILMVGFLDDPAQDTMMVPKLEGPFAGDDYLAYAFANGGAADPEDDDPMTATVLRGITALGSAVDFGGWMALPTALGVEAGEFGFDPVADAALHVASLRDAQGDEVWGITLLDGRTSFALPALSPDPLPSGNLGFVVTALDGAVDLENFEIDDFQRDMTGLSRNRASFTR